MDQRTLPSTAALSCLSGGKPRVDVLQPWLDHAHEGLDPLGPVRPLELSVQSGGHRPTPLVPEDHQQRDVQVIPRVLEAAHHVGRDDVTGDADDEQVAEALVEDQLGGHAAAVWRVRVSA
jgi:hypothetical protein